MRPGWLSRLAPPSSIPKNSAWLLAAFVAQKASALVIFVLLARHLGTGGFGTLAAVIAFGTVLAQGTELGVNVLLVRRVAVARGESGALLGTALLVKGLTSAAAVGLAVLALPLLGGSPALALPAMLVVAGALVEQISRSVCAVFVGQEKMEFEAGFTAARAAAAFLLVVGAILAGGGIAAVTAAFCLSEIAVLAFVFSLYRGRFQGTPLAVRLDLVAPMLRETLPIGAASALGVVYSYADRILLWKIASPEEVGIYDAAYRVLSALIIIPLIAGRAVYPVLSRTYEPDGQEARTVMAKVLKALLVLALPIAAGGILVAGRFLAALYGENYRAGAPALGLILVANGFIFLSWVPKTALLAARRGREFLIVSAATTGVNLLANVVLVPWLGAAGAAAATLAGEALALAMIHRYTARMFPRLSAPPHLFAKAAGATGLLCAVVVLLRAEPLAIQIAGSALVYAAAVALLGLLGPRDIRALAALRPAGAAPLPRE